MGYGSGISSRPSNQDLFSRVAIGALQAKLKADDQRFQMHLQDREQANRMAYQGAESTAIAQRQDAARTGEDAADQRRAQREQQSAAFDTILKAITAGAEVTPELQDQAHTLSGLDPQTTNILLDAASRGAAALQATKASTAKAEGEQKLKEIAATNAGRVDVAELRGSNSRVGAGANSDKPVDVDRRRRAVDGYLKAWAEINPGKRPVDAPPIGTPVDVLERVAALKVDKHLSTSAALASDAASGVAIELTTEMDLDADQIDEEVFDTNLLSNIAKAMGISFTGGKVPKSLAELASTGASADILKPLVKAYVQHKATAGLE